MKLIKLSRSEAIPDGVTVHIKSRNVTVTGPRGTLKRSFKHQSFDMFVKDKRVYVEVYFGDRETRSVVRTIVSHIRNMMTGVSKGFEYKMRFVYAHFPHNVTVTENGSAIEIRNFLGQKKVRRVQMSPGVKLVRSDDVKDQIVLTGNDIELVSQSASRINIASLVRNKDVRKFLDGVYVSDKGVLGASLN